MTNINTSCEQCVFSEYDGDRQVACKAGRLDAFLRQGSVVSRAVNPETNREFYHIENRVCVLCRNIDSNWARETPPEEQLGKAREECTIRCLAVVHVPHGATVEDVVVTADALAAQQLPPRLTEFVLVSNAPSSLKVITALRRRFPSESGFAWNVRVIARRNEGKPVGRGEAIDDVVNSVRAADFNYYLAVDAGAKPRPSLIRDVDAAINDRLEQFLLLEPVVGRFNQVKDNLLIGPLVQVRAHQTVRGNARAEYTYELDDGQVYTARCDTVEAKLIQLAGDQDKPEMVRSLSEICHTPA